MNFFQLKKSYNFGKIVGFAQRSEVLIDDEDHADIAATTATTRTFERKRSKDYLRFIIVLYL